MSNRTEIASPLLALDVGNTSVKCALLGQEKLRPVFRVQTRPVDTLAERMQSALPAGPEAIPTGCVCVASSVHPAADPALEVFCAAVGARGPRFFGRELTIPIETDLAEPDKVGTDRLLLALGARRLAGAPCAVVGAGTAITIDLVDARGCFRGGAIAPGFGLSASALHRQAALLPEVKIEGPALVPGKDTAEAIRAGVYWSCVGGVLALVERYAETTGREGIGVVYTGADAPLLTPALPRGSLHVPDLIFQGMEAALRDAE